jgi:hypothetical protein
MITQKGLHNGNGSNARIVQKVIVIAALYSFLFSCYSIFSMLLDEYFQWQCELMVM